MNHQPRPGSIHLSSSRPETIPQGNKLEKLAATKFNIIYLTCHALR